MNLRNLNFLTITSKAQTTDPQRFFIIFYEEKTLWVGCLHMRAAPGGTEGTPEK